VESVGSIEKQLGARVDVDESIAPLVRTHLEEQVEENHQTNQHSQHLSRHFSLRKWFKRDEAWRKKHGKKRLSLQEEETRSGSNPLARASSQVHHRAIRHVEAKEVHQLEDRPLHHDLVQHHAAVHKSRAPTQHAQQHFSLRKWAQRDDAWRKKHHKKRLALDLLGDHTSNAVTSQHNQQQDKPAVATTLTRRLESRLPLPSHLNVHQPTVVVSAGNGPRVFSQCIKYMNMSAQVYSILEIGR